MSGETHSAVGAAAGLINCALLPGIFAHTNDTLILSVGASVIGALFADLDSEKSKGNKILNKVLITGCTGILLGAISVYSGLVSIAKLHFNVEQLVTLAIFFGMAIYARSRPHREMTHSFAWATITTLCVYSFAGGLYWVWYALGYLSHLAIDYLNERGECLLWPKKTRYCLKLCSSSGLANKVTRYVALGICAVCIVYLKAGV